MAYNASNIRNSVMRAARFKVADGKFPKITVPDNTFITATFVTSNGKMIEFSASGSKIVEVKSYSSNDTDKFKISKSGNTYTIDDGSDRSLGEGVLGMHYTYSEDGMFPTIEDAESSFINNESGDNSIICNFNQFWFIDDTIKTTNAILTGSLTVDGASTFNNNVEMKENLAINGELTVSSTANFKSNVTITGRTIAGDITVNGQLRSESLELNANAAVDGTLTVNNGLTVKNRSYY